METSPGRWSVDASSFQEPTLSLIESLANKVHREGPKLGLEPAPPIYFFADLFVTLRQCREIAMLLCFINADEGQTEGFDRTKGYALQALQLVRALIDRLYNVCSLLEEPTSRAPRFRASGYKKANLALEEDKCRYGHLTDTDWPRHLAVQAKLLQASMDRDGINIRSPQCPATWLTLGRYLQSAEGKSERGKFLNRFIQGFWRDYSGLSHGTFEGLFTWAFFSMPDVLPHDMRPELTDTALRTIAVHLGRAFGVIACLLTEIQAYFHFEDDATNIDDRLHRVWNALVVIPEVREMFNARYRDLMEQKGIRPKLDLSKLRESRSSTALS